MAKLTFTERTLASVKVDADNPLLTWYAPFIAAWPVDQCGSVPTPAMLAVAALFKKHGAGREAVWHAMTLRPEGATVQQFLRSGVANGTAHNHLKALCDAGYFERSKAPGPGQAITFHAAITEAGAAKLNELMVVAGLKKAPKVLAGIKAKAAKVSRKANKAKAAVEAASVAVGAAVAAGATEPAVAAHADAEPVAGADALEQLAAHFNS